MQKFRNNQQEVTNGSAVYTLSTYNNNANISSNIFLKKKPNELYPHLEKRLSEQIKTKK